MVTGFDRLYGLELDALSDCEVAAHVLIADEHKQPTGIVHGGLYASIAESARRSRQLCRSRVRGAPRSACPTTPASSAQSPTEALTPSADDATAAARHRSGTSRSPTTTDAPVR
jgi:hypothetical protein